MKVTGNAARPRKTAQKWEKAIGRRRMSIILGDGWTKSKKESRDSEKVSGAIA